MSLEKGLELNLRHLKALVENTSDCIWELDIDGVITYVNPTIESLLGYRVQEMVGKTPFHFMEPGEARRVKGFYWRMLKEKAPFYRLEFVLIHKDGRQVHMETSGVPVFDGRGELEGYQGIGRDITHLKQAEEKVSKMEQEKDLILDNANEIIAFHDRDHRLIWGNKAYFKGITTATGGVANLENTRGMKCYQAWGMDKLCRGCPVSLAMQTGQPQEGELTPDNQEHWPETQGYWSIRAAPVRDSTGAIVGAIEVAHNITHLKQAEKALKNQLMIEKVISEISSTFVSLPAGDIYRGVDHALKRVGELLGMEQGYLFLRSPGDQVFVMTHGWCGAGIMPKRDLFINIPGESFPWPLGELGEAGIIDIPLVSGMPPGAASERAMFHLQDTKSLLAVPVVSENKLLGFLGLVPSREKKEWTDEQVSLLRVVADLVSGALARQQAKRNLETVLEEYETVFQGTQDAMFLVEVVGSDSFRYIRNNLAHARATGYSREDFKGRSPQELVGEEAGKLICENYIRCLGEGGAISYEETLELPVGKRVWHTTLTPIIREGKSSYIVGSSQDITSRKQAEENLRRERGRYKNLIVGTNVGTWEWNVQTGETVFNDRWAEIVGYSLEELQPTSIHTWEALSHPQDLIKSQELLEKHFAGELPYYDCECRMRHKEGHWVWVQDRGQVLTYDRDGEPLMMFGTHLDITHRKLSEQKMADYALELEELYRQLDQELEKAWQVHQRVLPQSLPEVKGLSLGVHYQPARKMGGDFYSVIRVGHQLVLYLSDVSGHGLDGAMLTILLKEAIDSFLTLRKKKITPGNLLRHLCHQYRRENYSEEYFICILLAVLDLETRELSYTGAGFQDTPLVRMGDGRQLELRAPGLPVSNAFPPGLLDIQENRLTLTPGTTILFHTDGLTEQVIPRNLCQPGGDFGQAGAGDRQAGGGHQAGAGDGQARDTCGTGQPGSADYPVGETGQAGKPGDPGHPGDTGRPGRTDYAGSRPGQLPTGEDPGWELYGTRLNSVFYQACPGTPEEIIRAINQDFKLCNRGSLQGEDDITYVILRVEE